MLNPCWSMGMLSVVLILLVRGFRKLVLVPARGRPVWRFFQTVFMFSHSSISIVEPRRAGTRADLGL